MAKFNISQAQPGQVDKGTQAVVETPVEQIQESVPQGGAFEALMNQQPTDVDQAAGEIVEQSNVDPDIAAQQERERVKPLGERFQEAAAGAPKWEPKAQTSNEVSDTKSGIANIRARSKNMVDLVKKKELAGGWGISSSTKLEGVKVKDVFLEQGQEAGTAALQQAAPNKPSAIFSKIGASQVTPQGTQVDPNFIATLSAVTENFMMSAQVASEGGAPKEKVDEFTGEKTGEYVRPQEDYEVSKAQGNSRLGQDIHREYQRIKNQQEGKPTDQYNDLSPTEATVLGDMAKELYAEANPNLIQRIEGDKNNPVRFIVTARGIDELKLSGEARKRMFPTQNTRPSKTILPGGSLVGEGAKLNRKRTTKAGNLGKTREIDQAMENLHTIPHVVDPRRSRVLMATALPSIMGAINGNYEGTWNNLVGIGKDQLNSFTAAKIMNDKRNAKAAEQAAKKGETFIPNEYNIRENMDSQVDTLAQSLRALAMERQGANYLTYAMQSFTGRVHPQQTYFDPTASKIVRFATRNATPVVAKPGSRQEANLKQMYAMMFIKEASEALPKKRLELLKIHSQKIYDMGAQVEAALNEQMPAQLADQVAQAIDQNIPLTDPKFPQVPELKLPDNIVAYINKRGEDGLSVLEGLIDYKHFVDNYKAGKPHSSYFNAYMDGKTNGIANNGIQLGSKEVAERTGVIRTNTETLLDAGDIRAALADAISSISIDGIPGSIDNKGPIYDVLMKFGEKGGLARDLQKETTMQFGYGKELESFKQDIEEYVEKFIANDPDFGSVYQRALGEVDGNADKLNETIWTVYMDSLVKTLSDEAADARAVMRANATMFGLMNEIFSIEGPSGFNINIAGTNYEMDADADVSYYITKDGKQHLRTATIGTKEDTSAAARHGAPGMYAYGRSLPAPVQSIDAATVAKTVTGRSWEKLKQNSQGNPYVHTIYDAFKVDANSYDVVLEESNKNWLNTSFDWSYLEKTKDAYKEKSAKFWRELNSLPDNQVIDHAGVGMMNYLLTAKGDRFPLTNKIIKTQFISNMDAKAIGERAKKQTEYAISNLAKMGWKPGQPTTVAQYKWFMKFMQDQVYNLHEKNSRIVAGTNAKKQTLRKQIDPKKVYQYYSH